MPAARAKKKPWNNTVVAILHLTNLCIGLAICFFVAEYQRSQLSALNVSNEEIEGKGLIVLVKSSETPEVSVVQEALERYRAFLKQWRAHSADQETGDY